MTWVKRHWDGFRQKIKELWRELWRHVRAWSLFHTVIVMIIICLAALAGAWYLWSWWAHIWSSQTNTTVNLDTVSLATVGGLGGLVALVVSYRKQAMNERNEADGKLSDAVHLLGDLRPSTRIAGVYALANVGDRYPNQRQQIIDILCGYLRTKRENDGPTESTIITALRNKLKKDSWAKDQDIKLDLHGANISEYFNLSGAKIRNFVCHTAAFKGGVAFEHTTFERATSFAFVVFDSASFKDSRFNGNATFEYATFKSTASFKDSRFNGNATFNNATFKSTALFDRATFNGKITFSHPPTSTNSATTEFADGASFEDATFNNDVTFDNVAFTYDALFDRATFNGKITFTYDSELTGYENLKAFKRTASFEDATFNGKITLINIEFCIISFKFATFNNDVTFDNVEFYDDIHDYPDGASFEDATFNNDVTFHNVTFHNSVSFDHATFKDKAVLEKIHQGSIFKSHATFNNVKFKDASDDGE